MVQIEQLALDQHLLVVEADIEQLDWDLPGYLFGLHHGNQGLSSEPWMEIPGPPGDLLQTLGRLRLRASLGVHGLLMMMSSVASRGLLAVTREGATSVAVRETGRRPSTAHRLPRALGDHDHLVVLALQLLAGGER